MKYVIIGNSTAAIGCIEGIRSVDKDGEITVISNEKYHTYSRPLISYLLYGKTTLQKMKYRKDSFYEDNGVKTLFSKTVVSIDKDKKQVKLDDGKTLAYDKLMVATGSRAFVPPMDGLDTVKNKFTFMSLDDALGLEECITKDSRVLIIGAGLIGLKCAEGIYKKVSKITVIDLAPRILSSILDDEGAKMVQTHIENQGVEFVLSQSVKSFDKNTATLQDGSKIDFDALVIAIGVRPNTELVSAIGGKVNRGVITDIRQETSIKDIYSAGDCCESYDITIDSSRILALLPNAYVQGLCAGTNMAGGECEFDKAIPMNAIGLLGLHIITAGSYEGDEYTIKTENSYKKLVTKDNLLKGYILIGEVERAGIYTSLIREKTPLDSIDFELIKQKPQLMAFSKVERKKQLGGAK